MDATLLTVPLTRHETGVLRVGATRVSLDSVIYAFKKGASPAEIVAQYDTLDLSQVYAVISYYLQNRAEIERYLTDRERESIRLQQEVEARFPPDGIRARLAARRKR